MPSVSAIIEHGSIPTANLTNESNLLVQSVTYSGMRDTQEYKDADGAIQGLQERNPRLSMAFDAYVTSFAGLAAANPGQEVTSLASFASPVLGFTPGDGTLVYRDPVITESNTEAAKITFTVVQYPFCT